MNAENSMRIPIVFSETDSAFTNALVSTISSARAAQSRWARTSLRERLQLVRALRELIAENAMRLAESSASARNRPALESLTAEVLPLAEACRFLEREAETVLAARKMGKRHRPLWLAGVKAEIHREPLGVVLVIGPGNYPLLLPGVQVIQALVAGNSVLLKPGVGGTNTAQVLCELIIRAGFDPQLVHLLPESSTAARDAIAARPDKVLFTGSATTGEKILAQLAPHLIPATMELSGCDAVIVRADADLDLTVSALKFGVLLNNGATCMAPKRVFVSRAIATELEGRLAREFSTPSGRTGNLPVPSGDSPLGTGDAQTFSNESVFARNVRPIPSGQWPDGTGGSPVLPTEKIRSLLNDALSRGAHFVVGGIRENGEATMPIVLCGVSPESHLLREDVFAPVISLVTVADDDEAVTRANDCPYALGASVFSRDEAEARSLAARINAGVVTINDLILPTADARLPFGGRGRSGFGSTRGAEGLLELTTPKVVTVTRSKFRPAFETTQSGDEQLFQSYLKLTHGRGLSSRWRAFVSLIKTLSRRRKTLSQEKL